MPTRIECGSGFARACGRVASSAWDNWKQERPQQCLLKHENEDSPDYGVVRGCKAFLPPEEYVGNLRGTNLAESLHGLARAMKSQ